MAKNTLRSGQTVTTFGPGAMIDLPDSAVIVGGLEFWNYDAKELKPKIEEPRLLASIRQHFERMEWSPPQYLFRPPVERDFGHGFSPHIVGWEFPEWFMVQKSEPTVGQVKRRRMVPKALLEKKAKFRDDSGKFLSVVPIRFVRACNRGHCDDIDWRAFVHGGEESQCMQPLYIEERGSSGTLADTWIVCGCGVERSMSQAAKRDFDSLGPCSGRRPWLGAASNERCGLPSRLLIRSASNAYFPQLLSVISIPDSGSELATLIGKLWEKGLKGVAAEGGVTLSQVRQFIPDIGAALEPFSDEEVTKAIAVFQGAADSDSVRPVKSVELEALTRAEEETGFDEPDGDFFARELDPAQWKTGAPWMKGIRRIVLVHRLREVVAQLAFTRFESITPSLSGEYDELALQVEPAVLSRNENWLPATENRGEGIFLQFDSEEIQSWAGRERTKGRAALLESGFHEKFSKGDNVREFHGAPFYMVHSFSHLLINQISLECGYPSSSLRERIYAENGVFGILIYTGSPDAEGTLGGLVQAGWRISGIVFRALQSARLCSNDPVCSAQEPNPDTQRELLGAACHGCLLIAETSCEQRNCFLDRSLVVDAMNNAEAHFFSEYEA